MKRRLCLIGLHRWTRFSGPYRLWNGLVTERMCTRCGRFEVGVR